MVSFLLRPNSARLPLFAASYKHYKQWVSIGGDPSDLDSINPEDRRIPYYLRLPSTRLAFFNHGLPWEGYMPCSLIDGLDPLRLLILAPALEEIILEERGRFRIAASWIIAICEIAKRIETAGREIHDQAGDLFKRGEDESRTDYRPISFGPERLEIDFKSRQEAEARVELVRAAALCNTAFLAWFTSTVHSWHAGLSDDVIAFVKSLRLDEREMKGYVFNLAVDYPWVDLQLLIEHGVPVHYLWSPLLDRNPRFTRANPWLIARVLELKKRMGREPSDEEVLKGQGAAKAVLDYDRWFQPRLAEVDLHPLSRSSEPENYVQYFYGWHPHPLSDGRILARAKEAYQMGDPRSMEEMETCFNDVNVIYRWAKKGAERVEDDDLEDWAIFDVPEAYRQGDFMHGRELRRLTCAPFPAEMYDKPLVRGEGKEVENAEYHGLAECAGAPFENETWSSRWTKAEEEVARFDYDSREGRDEPPQVPVVPCNRSRRYDSDDEEPSLLRRMGPPPLPAKPKPLAERLGPAVASALQAGPSHRAGTSRADSRSRERGRSRARAPTREPALARGGQSVRRSASPPAARAASSLSSSTVASTSSRDYAAAIPDPSIRWSVVYPSSGRWNALVEQHQKEVGILMEVLTAKVRPRSADAEGRIRWSDRVLKEGYIVLLLAQHQVRMYVWRTLLQFGTIEDFLEQFASTGAPMLIALPQALYPSPDQDQALEDEETHSATFPLYGIGGKDLFTRWKGAVRSLARKPYAGALYFSSDIAGFVLRRYAWDLVSSKVGAGPCEETRLHRSGQKFFRGGAYPSLFCDYAESEELALIHGCIVEALTGDKVSHRHAFPPANVWATHWPTKGEWGVEEQKYLTELAEAFEQGIAEIPAEGLWRDRVRDRSRSRKGAQFRKSDALQASDASAWAAHFERIHGGDRRFVRIADLGTRLTPSRLFE